RIAALDRICNEQAKATEAEESVPQTRGTGQRHEGRGHQNWEFGEMKIVRAVCPHDCPDTCAMLVEVDENGRAVRVKGDPWNPYTHGGLCVKVAHYEKRTYHADRLLYPMKRAGRKGDGNFERISWDEALGTIAGKLKAIANESPESILPYSYAGTMGLLQGSS